MSRNSSTKYCMVAILLLILILSTMCSCKQKISLEFDALTTFLLDVSFSDEKFYSFYDGGVNGYCEFAVLSSVEELKNYFEREGYVKGSNFDEQAELLQKHNFFDHSSLVLMIFAQSGVAFTICELNQNKIVYHLHCGEFSPDAIFVETYFTQIPKDFVDALQLKYDFSRHAVDDQVGQVLCGNYGALQLDSTHSLFDVV